MEDQSTTPTSLSTSTTSEGEDAHLICFLDLDDTLIPTTWMRTRYERLWNARRLRAGPTPKPTVLDIDLYRSVKSDLDAAVSSMVDSAVEIDDLIVEFLDIIAQKFDTVVIVTNARSHAWVAAFHQTFPKLSAHLAKLNIRIIKTNPLAPEPTWSSQPQDYFKYWSLAKLEEFERIILRLRTVGIRQYRMTCIGDNNFEHYAFIQLCEKYRPKSAHIVKCTCGLKPRCFTRQISSMARCIQANPRRRRKYRESEASAEGLRRILLCADSSGKKHIQSLSWNYEEPDLDAYNDDIDTIASPSVPARILDETTSPAKPISMEFNPLETVRTFFQRTVHRA